MANLIIIGRGGFAKEIESYIVDSNLAEHKIKGFLEVYPDREEKFKFYETLQSDTFKDYIFDSDDIFILAIGRVEFRIKIVNFMLSLGAKFENLIHNRATISRDIKLGIGNFIGVDAIISPNVSIGDFNLIYYSCIISHDCIIENHNVLSPRVTITGEVKIANNNFFGVSVTLTPRINLGNNNKIQAGLTLFDSIDNLTLIVSESKPYKMVGLSEKYNY